MLAGKSNNIEDVAKSRQFWRRWVAGTTVVGAGPAVVLWLLDVLNLAQPSTEASVEVSGTALVIVVATILGVVQALVLRYESKRNSACSLTSLDSSLWALAWVVAGAVLVPLDQVLDDWNIIGALFLANALQVAILERRIRGAYTWLLWCVIGLIASVVVAIAMVIIVWLIVSGDAPTTGNIVLAWTVSIITYAMVTGRGLARLFSRSHTAPTT